MNNIIWQILTVIMAALFGLCLYLATRLKNSLKASLEREEKAYQELLDYPSLNPNPVMRLNKAGELIYANLASAPILAEWGITLNEKIPAQWREVMRQVLLAQGSQPVALMANDQWYSLNILPMSGGYVGIFAMNVTTQKAVEKKLAENATTDPLTKLPNRLIFIQNLAIEINHAKAGKVKFGTFIIRVDDYFEIVNTYDQNIADQFILAFSERLQEFATGESALARLTEKEFAIIAADIHEPGPMASFVQSLMEKCSVSYHIADKDIFTTLSIGIVFYPNDGEDTDTLIRNAQLAVNRTSDTRNQYEFFQRGMVEQLQVRRSLITDLHKALAENQFVVYYQPQIHLLQRRMVSCESLIRWNHPEKGFISPAFFIPTAEETPLIIPIGEWILRQACQQIVKWQQEGYPSIVVAVNVSARQLFQSDIIEVVRTVMQETKIPPECLEIEITESAFIDNMDKAIEIMKGLRALGVELALDDFGTGYSSLSYLMQFPVNKLKIDRSFVKIIEEDSSQSYAVTRGIIELGHSLNLKMIAEGVETKAQLKYLKDHKCDLIQGFYFSQPVPAEKMPELFNKEWKS